MQSCLLVEMSFPICYCYCVLSMKYCCCCCCYCCCCCCLLLLLFVIVTVLSMEYYCCCFLLLASVFLCCEHAKAFRTKSCSQRSFSNKSSNSLETSLVSRCGLAVRRQAGNQRDLGLNPLRLSFLSKSCGLWSLSCDFVPHN